MSSLPPDLTSRSGVQQLLAELNIACTGLHPFASEMDHLWRISQNWQHLVLRISGPAMDASRVEFENQLLKHLEKSELELRIPRLRSSDKLEYGGKTYSVRTFDWLDGILLADYLPRDKDLLIELGTQMGTLTAALQDFEHSVGHQPHIWKIDNLPWVEEHISVHETARQPLIKETLDEIKNYLLPLLPSLRESIIHHDANERNIVIDASYPNIRWGIIDFGDACHTKTCLDAAIACTYIMMISQGDCLQDGMHFLSGYCRSLPLKRDEVDALVYLIKARLLISLTHSTLRKESDPENEYNQVSHDGAWKLLLKLSSLDSEWISSCFRQVCGVHGPSVRLTKIAAAGPIFPLLGSAVKLSALPIIDLSVSTKHLGTMSEIMDAGRLNDMIQSQLVEGWGIGRYLEPRPIYTTDAFSTSLCADLERRTIHLGIDVFAPAMTPIHAPLKCRVAQVQNYQRVRDYGPTLVLEILGDTPFYLLLGHLHKDVLDQMYEGKEIDGGEMIAKVGNIGENGGWPPHVHVQIFRSWIAKDPGLLGVASPSYLDVWKELSPNPAFLLGLSQASQWQNSSAKLSDLREKLLPPNLSLSYKSPLHIVRGYGAYLMDQHGQRYLDMVNNVAHVGHENPHIVRVIQRQAALLNTNTRYLHQSLVDFCQSLLTNAPSDMDTVFLCNSGSEANDLAMRIARTITGRKNLLAIEGGYHGHTQCCLDVSSYKFAGKGGQGKPEHVALLPLPDKYRGRYMNEPQSSQFHLDATDALKTLDSPPAAFIHESIMSCAGQVVLPDDYLATVYQVMREHDVITIADEVQTGCGRPGSCFWAFELQGVKPDMITVGKPIGNGHPLAAVITRKDIADQFANGMEYFNTFAGNPVSCEVGQAVLTAIKRDKLMEKALFKGRRIQLGLQKIQAQSNPPIIGEVRGHGLFIGIEFVTGASLDPNPEAATYVVEQMLNHHILLSTDGLDNNVIKIKPPLVISDVDIDFFLEKFEHVMQHNSLRQPVS